jgi:hypothetical protein
MIKKLGMLAAVCAAVALVAVPAKAIPIADDVYTFDFEGSALGHDLDISGTLTASHTADSNGARTITSITGTVQYYGVSFSPYNSTIVALLPAGDTTFTITNDNLLYYPASPGAYLDGFGLSFVDSLNIRYRLFGDHAPCSICADPAQVDIFPLDLVPGNFVAVATPVPAALPLFATGLGVLGFLARRRRKAAA